MICFPNAKINLGLDIVAKRSDGYHNIETVFYPIACQDVLECVPADEFQLKLSGISLDGKNEDNIVAKAYRLLAQHHPQLKPCALHLHKNIPCGAGLGGGSADAAFALKLINDAQHLNIPMEKLEEYASSLGADCRFFLRNQAVFAEGKGDEFTDINLSLKGYYIVLVKPDIHISTAEAYAGVRPEKPAASLLQLIQQPIETWEEHIFNGFEKGVFEKHPEIKQIKEELYAQGAVYASMSGSGSSVFGIFSQEVHLQGLFEKYFYWADFLQ